jgi:hypothetical protein
MFDPSRLWLGQVRPLLSSLSNSLGAGGSRREATRILFSAKNFMQCIQLCVRCSRFPCLLVNVSILFKLRNVLSTR